MLMLEPLYSTSKMCALQKAERSSVAKKPISAHVERRLTPLIDKWNLYYHLPYDKTWDVQSYKIIMGDIATTEQLIGINEIMPDEVVKTCMLFVMKTGVLPLWEDPKNRTGGAFSFKILNKSVHLVWRQLFYLLCGGTLMVDRAHMSLVNGLSISPKKGFCIVKIWLRDCSLQDPNSIVEIPDLCKRECLFRKHEPEF
jgi:hypothetical protein